MTTRKDEIKARLLAMFQVEAQEHLQAITANLLALDRGLPAEQTDAAVETTFRGVHTLKGAARSVSLTDIETLCQACESVLSKISHGRLTLTRPILARLIEAVEGIARLLAGGGAPAGAPTGVSELIGRLEAGGREQEVGLPPEPSALPLPIPHPPTPTPQSPPPVPSPPSPAPPDTIRLAAAKVDALLLQAEDLLSPKLAAGERIGEARALVEAAAGRWSPDPRLAAVEAKARELLTHLIRDQRTITKVVDGLQDEMRRVRMIPAATVLDLFPGMVRELADTQGKEVEWLVRGDDLELDRKVLDAIKDPLIHLIRNAVDHGIEPPGVRTKIGKRPARGRVTVSVIPLESHRIEVRVEDDGRGIDPAQVRAAAVRGRLLTAEAAEALTEDQALDLIYRSGLSTSPMITALSGHGLGLAIVKERVEALGGQLRVETRTGAGTTVRMTLPVAVAVFRGLLVRVGAEGERGGQSFLLPLEAVERAIRLAPGAVEPVEGRDVIRWDGRPLLIVRLSEVLRLQPSAVGPQPEGAKLSCVILRSGEERAAFVVEEVLGDQEVMVKDLQPPLVRIRNVAGAGLLGSGRVVLILRPADLVEAARITPRSSAPSAAQEEKPGQPAILVVDDSITTRTMENNLLAAAGYQVRVAVDGMEAWTILKSEAFDLVLSDVDMPRMDGFELTGRIRADRRLADIPVVLVTALESREDKERGIEVGANAYVVKSSFDQSNLLEIIRRLI
ncbi:MAG: response regulator [Nitrospirae bacterium]|nr:response regulator [Nitrospirota bacterium]